jgi:hypothetical protein
LKEIDQGRGRDHGTQCGDPAEEKIMPDQDENTEYSFQGEYEFDLTIEMLGRRITRNARAVYEHTPCWEYFDLKKNALRVVDNSGTAFYIEILAMRQEFHEDGTVTDEESYWARVTAIIALFDDLTDALCVAIDDQCWSEDEERRKKHKGGRGKQASTSRRRALRQ